MAVFFVTVIIFVINVCISYGEINVLLAVAIIFKHGESTPFQTYKNDPYKDKQYWSAEKGKLNEKGEDRLYNLGKWFRVHYGDFVPEQYLSKDVYVRATDSDRSLMSAEYFLDGFYGISRKYHPTDIPIHIVRPASADNLLKMMTVCPKYKRLLKEVLENSYYSKINEENKKLYELLTEKTGEDIKDFIDAQKVYTWLEHERHDGFVLPDWTKEVFPEKLIPLGLASFSSFVNTTAQQRLKCGLFLNNLIATFHAAIINPKYIEKFFIFSGHKSGLSNILYTLGYELDEFPFWGSTLIFELRRNGVHQYVVNILYKRIHEVEKINLKTCEFSCELVKFRKILEPVLISSKDWDDECLT